MNTTGLNPEPSYIIAIAGELPLNCPELPRFLAFDLKHSCNASCQAVLQE